MSPFSTTIMDHFLNPRHTGPLSNPDGEGWGGHPNSSRYMQIQLNVESDTIVDVRFATYGCAPAIAAGSYLCDWCIGRSIHEAQAVTDDHLNEWLGGLPPARRFCANLAVDALHAALADAHSLKEAAHS